MLKLDEVKLGAVGHDTITAVKGTVTGKYERIGGNDSVLIEGLDATGRPFTEWVALDRFALDG